MNDVLGIFGRLQGSRPTDGPEAIARRMPSRSAGMNIEVVRDWTRVVELGAEWNALLARSRSDTIFLTWEWIRVWVKVVGRQYSPFVVVVRDASHALCGLAPFYFQPFSLLGALPCRVLRLMADRLTGAEYPDWIVRVDCEQEASACIVKALNDHSDDWDCIWMPWVSGWTGACERIVPACASAGLRINARTVDFSEVSLPDSVRAYDAVLGDSRLRKFRWQRNKIMRSGKVKISRCASAVDLPRYLDALMQLHTARRSVLGDEGCFVSRPEEAKFYREFAPVALNAGWLAIWALIDDGAFKAVQLGYVYKGTFYSLQEGFDPSYLPGAGNMLRLAVIRHCIENGIRHYDFLGGYTEHKARWGAKLRTGHDLFIGRPGLVNRLMFAASVWPTGRYLRPVERHKK